MALLLTCGDGEERGEVYGCAADRQQASIVFEVAADMVRMCPALNKRVKILASQKRIVYQSTNSFYQVLSAEAYSKHGFNIHGVVFDELHTQPNRKLFDVMTKGSGDARTQPLYFLITTAGTDTNSICYETHQKLTILEQKYPECANAPSNGDSVPADSNGVISKGGGATSFPSFDGKDLDGNDIKSSDFFKSNNVTVVNYWFSTCKPCVGELPELEALNKKLAEKGGQVVGINTFTIDGDRTAISEAKDILSKKGVTYKNIWFDSNSDAGKFTSGLFSYPTTYVVDKNGNIVGEPIVGAITEKNQAKTLEKLIDQALQVK